MEASSPSRARATPRSPSRWLVLGAIAAIVGVSALFVARYATEMPLTDEWAFLRSVMELEDVDRSAPGWPARFLDASTLRFNGHVVALPFAIYRGIAPAVDFDQRWFVALTLATFLLQLVIYRRWIGSWSPALVPIALVLFGLGHYMEFLWGFEFTLALSISLPMAGLAAIDAIGPLDRAVARWGKLALGLALVLLGALSSLGGLFGFPAALVLVATKGWPPRRTLALLAAVALATAAAVALLPPEGGERRPFGAHEALHVLTALGGLVWSTPVGLSEFGFDLASATGLAILLALAAVVVRAAARRELAAIALPLSFVAFGLASLGSIAVSRPYLGNWHLQHGLPAVCGAFACAYGAWRREPRAVAARVPFAVLTAALLASAGGSVRAFREEGPAYHAYVRSIEEYALGSMVATDLEKPYPLSPPLDLELLLYLSASGHALFEREPEPATWRDAEGARVFLDGQEAAAPLALAPARVRRRVTVLLPLEPRARDVRLEAGDLALRLHRIHADLARVPGAEGAACYAGLLRAGSVDRPLPARVRVGE